MAAIRSEFSPLNCRDFLRSIDLRPSQLVVRGFADHVPLSATCQLKRCEEPVATQQKIAGQRAKSRRRYGDQFLVSRPRGGMVEGSQAIVEVSAADRWSVGPGHVVAIRNLPIIVHRHHGVDLRPLRCAAYRSREAKRHAEIKRIGHEDFGRCASRLARP